MQIRLRPIRKEDVEATLLWHNDEEISRQILSFPPPIAREMEEEWVAALIRSEGSSTKHFRVIEQIVDEQAKPVGFIQLTAEDENSETMRLGIVIGEPKLRGLGLGLAALKLMTNWAFHDFGLKKIVLEVRLDNVKAIRFYERFGFRKLLTRVKQSHGRQVEMLEMELCEAK